MNLTFDYLHYILLSDIKGCRALASKAVEETTKIVYELTEETHRSIPKPLHWLLRKFMFSPIFLKIAQSSSKNVFDHPDSWKIV